MLDVSRRLIPSSRSDDGTAPPSPDAAHSEPNSSVPFSAYASAQGTPLAALSWDRKSKISLGARIRVGPSADE